MKRVLIIITGILIFLNIVFSIIGNTAMFGIRTFKIVSGSMIPTINIGDLIMVKDMPYKVGDILTVKEKNSYITHRLIEFNNNEIILKGDANNANDEGRNIKHVVGKVVLIIPAYMYLIIRYSCIILIIILVIVIFIGDRNEKEKSS